MKKNKKKDAGTPKIGFRMALGADRAKVVRMVLRGASYRVLIGIAAGIPLAVGAGKLLSAELYGVESWDPTALLLAACALLTAAAAQWRVPSPLLRLMPSAVVSIYMQAATATPSRRMMIAPSSCAMSLICSRTLRSRMSRSARL